MTTTLNMTRVLLLFQTQKNIFTYSASFSWINQTDTLFQVHSIFSGKYFQQNILFFVTLSKSSGVFYWSIFSNVWRNYICLITVVAAKSRNDFQNLKIHQVVPHNKFIGPQMLSMNPDLIYSGENQGKD